MFLSTLAGFLIAVILMNLIAWAIESPMRFGWYNTENEKRGEKLG